MAQYLEFSIVIISTGVQLDSGQRLISRPLRGQILAVARAASELVGVAERPRARVGDLIVFSAVAASTIVDVVVVRQTIEQRGVLIDARRRH